MKFYIGILIGIVASIILVLFIFLDVHWIILHSSIFTLVYIFSIVYKKLYEGELNNER